MLDLFELDISVRKIQKIIFRQGSKDDRKIREISHKIVKLIVNNINYNERVQITPKSLNLYYKNLYKGDNN